MIKKITLFLNELNKDKVESLENSKKDYNFIEVRNLKAENFLNQINSLFEKFNFSNIRNLFFIDPYGYTQYGTENLKTLLKNKNSDYLIFIPTNFIYRFKEGQFMNGDGPAKKFLLDLGIGKPGEFKHSQILTDAIANKFKIIADIDFSYNYSLKKQNNELFHLFFITKKAIGAEKFLEATKRVEEKIRKQGLLFNPDKDKKLKHLLNFLKTKRNNKEAYIEGLKLLYYLQILKMNFKSKRIKVI